MADAPGAAGSPASDPAADGPRTLKRKKTVTWAEDDELELPLGPPDGSGGPPPAGTDPVLVLPADGLFDALTADLLQEQEDVPALGDASEPLTRRQLVERRLARAGQLAALYEAELWGLLEELRLRHAQFVAEGRPLHKQAAAASSDGQKAQQQQQQAAQQKQARAAGDVGEPPAKKARQQAPQAGKPAGEAADAGAAFEGPGAGLRALWQKQQQQQRQAAAGPGALLQAGGQQQQQQQQQQQPPQPRFEAVEALVLSGGADVLPPVDGQALVQQRARFVRHLELLGRLEQGALAATCRELDAVGGMGLLCGRARRYVLRRPCASLGRASGSGGKVDVDLSAEAAPGDTRISRQQAQLWLDADGGWRVRCTGRRPMRVNGAALGQGATCALPTLSHLAVGGVSLLFVGNVAAAARAVARAAQPAA